MNSYSLSQWVLFFYIYCFFGWCFESAYVSIKEKHFVNRGFLRLPMLPIYGSGALAILVVTIPVRTNLVFVYVLGTLSATLLELVTGAAMEAIFKMRYWDYSDQKFNYKGYICLSSSIAWGFLAILLTEFIHKPIEQFVLNVNVALKWSLLGVITVLFVSDLVGSVKAAWDLRKLLEQLEKLKEKTEELEQKLEQQKEKIAESVAEQKEKLAESVAEQKERIAESVAEQKEKLAESVAEQKEKIAESVAEQKEKLAVQKERLARKKEQLGQRIAELPTYMSETGNDDYDSVSERMRKEIENLWEERRTYMEKTNFLMRSQLRGNPNAKSKKFGHALADLKEKAKQKREKKEA